MDEQMGFWVEDDETFEQGFLLMAEDEFWTQDDASGAWAVRRFRGRKLRRGVPKGKGQGKSRGRKGYRRFVPWRKGKGKAPVHLSVSKDRPKGKGEGKKGKGKKGLPGSSQDLGKGLGKANVVTEATEVATVAETYQHAEFVNDWQESSWYGDQTWSSWGLFVEEVDDDEATDAALLTKQESWDVIDIEKSRVSVHEGCQGARP